jgi:hypothetical protein
MGNHNIFIYAGGVMLTILLAYMIYNAGRGNIIYNTEFACSKAGLGSKEGFESSNGSSKKKSSSRLTDPRAKENFLATSIKHFGTTKSQKSKHSDKLSKLETEKEKFEDSNIKKGSKDKKDGLAGLIKPGKVDHFKNVMSEVDNIDLDALSLSGFTDTIKKYNNNFNDRLEYARKNNNNNDLEAAMAQWDVLKDEFHKLFIFSDYI